MSSTPTESGFCIAARKSAYKNGTFYMYLGGLFVGVYVCVCEITLGNGSTECTGAEQNKSGICTGKNPMNFNNTVLL